MELLVGTMDVEDPTFEVLNTKLKALIEQKKTATPKPSPASSGAGGSGPAEKPKSSPASCGADGSDSGSDTSWLDAEKAMGEETVLAHRGPGAPIKLPVGKPYPSPYSPPPNPIDPKLQKAKKEFLKDGKAAFAAFEKEDGKTTQEWLGSNWAIAATVAKAKDQNSKKKSNSPMSDDESDKGGASGSAEALKLKVKTPEEIDKRRAKKARQALRRDIANALKKELGRAPTDKEVEAYMEREAEDIAKVEKIKGITQPKRQDKLMTYTGVLGDAKASPRGSTTEPEAMGAEIHKSTDDHALMLPWSVVQAAKEALMADPSLATEVFKEAQDRSRKRVHKDDSDGDDSSSSDNNEEAPKNRLSCCKARDCGKDNLKWSQFLLIDAEDADWQGFLWGVCQPCSAPSTSEARGKGQG